jgi:hypothetical protein
LDISPEIQMNGKFSSSINLIFSVNCETEYIFRSSGVFSNLLALTHNKWLKVEDFMLKLA